MKCIMCGHPPAKHHKLSSLPSQVSSTQGKMRPCKRVYVVYKEFVYNNYRWCRAVQMGGTVWGKKVTVACQFLIRDFQNSCVRTGGYYVLCH